VKNTTPTSYELYFSKTGYINPTTKCATADKNLYIHSRIFTINMSRLPDVDPELPEQLISMGFRKNVAYTLGALIQFNDPLTARDIERSADLRQPEVSLALTEIRKRGWLREEDYMSDGTRSGVLRKAKIKKYALHITKADILKFIQEEQQAKDAEFGDHFSKLKKILT